MRVLKPITVAFLLTFVILSSFSFVAAQHPRRKLTKEEIKNNLRKKNLQKKKKSDKDQTEKETSDTTESNSHFLGDKHLNIGDRGTFAPYHNGYDGMKYGFKVFQIIDAENLIASIRINFSVDPNIDHAQYAQVWIKYPTKGLADDEIVNPCSVKDKDNTSWCIFFEVTGTKDYQALTGKRTVKFLERKGNAVEMKIYTDKTPSREKKWEDVTK